MARDRLSDFLQAGNFHLLDVSFTIPMVMLPIFGFARCSAPEVSMDMYRIKEGNYEWPHHVIKGVEAQPIVLEQGIQILNSDFGDWARKAIIGRVAPKNLIIIHFTRKGFGDGEAAAPDGGLGTAFSFEFVKRIPGRAWILHNCRPTGWKVASDFDASSQDISVQSLTLDAEEIDEISLGV